MQAASDLTESVLANPGTPSSKTCPFASRPMTSRSTRYVCPTTTLLISDMSGRRKAPAFSTDSLIAVIPVFILCRVLMLQDSASRNSVRKMSCLKSTRRSAEGFRELRVSVGARDLLLPDGHVWLHPTDSGALPPWRGGVWRSDHCSRRSRARLRAGSPQHQRARRSPLHFIGAQHAGSGPGQYRSLRRRTVRGARPLRILRVGAYERVG